MSVPFQTEKYNTLRKEFSCTQIRNARRVFLFEDPFHLKNTKAYMLVTIGDFKSMAMARWTRWETNNTKHGRRLRRRRCLSSQNKLMKSVNMKFKTICITHIFQFLKLLLIIYMYTKETDLYPLNHQPVLPDQFPRKRYGQFIAYTSRLTIFSLPTTNFPIFSDYMCTLKQSKQFDCGCRISAHIYWK